MKVTSEQLPGSQVALQIEVDPEELEASKDRAYRRLANRTVVPGFRKGKAPRSLLERYLGPATVLQEALEELIPQVYQRAVQEQALVPIAEPQIEVTSLEPVSIKATVAVRPEVELGDYHSLRLEVAPEPVEEERVNEYLESLRHETAPWVPVERPANYGDLVLLDVQGSLDGRPLPVQEGISYILREDSPNPVPGFAEALVGIAKGEERQLSFSFPPDYPILSLAGHTFQYTVKALEIKEKQLPEMDDEFAKGVGVGYESLEALKERIRSDLQAQAEMVAQSRLEEQALDALVALAKVDLPEVLVEHEVDHLIQDRLEALQGSRIRLEDYLRETRKTEEALREELRPEARRRVLRTLVLQRFGELEGITVTDEDLENEIESRVEAVGPDGAQLREIYRDPQLRESLRLTLFRRRSMDRLLSIVRGEAAAQAEAKEEKPEEPAESHIARSSTEEDAAPEGERPATKEA